jgi:metal transporter CNNM
MSLNPTSLHILANSGDEQQRRWARRIQPIRANGHLLLVTLLLVNTLVNEALPYVIERVGRLVMIGCIDASFLRV